MKLQIPDIGDKLSLKKDWTFKLISEHRNEKLWEIFSGKKFSWRENGEVDVVFSKGTVLTVDRVYIRNGAKDFSSVSFRIDKSNDKRIMKKRFWAKLPDVNTIEINDIEKNDLPVLDFSEVHMPKREFYERWNKGKVVDNKSTVYIYIRETHKYTKMFRVDCVLEIEEKSYPWNGKDHKYTYVNKIGYTLKSLTGKILFETSSYEGLKKKAKEVLKKQIEEELEKS